MFLFKYTLFGSANQDVADYQSSLAQILRIRITAMTSERPTSTDIEFRQLWIKNLSSKMG